ncbi:glycosyltransferase family 4 protein [Candidatus Roizmanbacteria bacterium]|nr:glycosyltransferase family 4 protein [Candidatus Roizmanbacteria bacterium]
MALPIYVYDPTESDELSRVRGIGRYVHILKSLLPPESIFTADLKSIPKKSVFMNPFFNLLQPPFSYTRIAQKQIAVIHDVIPLKYPDNFPLGARGKLNVFLNKLTLNTYDHIIANSQTTKQDIECILHKDPARISVSYPCLDEQFLLQQSGDGSEILGTLKLQPFQYVLYVGDATWNKNLIMLAKAIKTANVSCVFVGKVFETINPEHPWQRELKGFLAEAKGDSRFLFPGFITDTQLRNLYQNAAANLLISRDEGFGYSFVEAAAQKTPSILSNIPIFHEIAGISAVFTAEDHPDNIARCIKKLMNEPAFRTELGEKAYKRVELFTFQKSKESLQKILLPVVSKTI